ncbi:hypothetical protein RF55_2317 [Lasius niger]|uniref:Uncharacterized protein n=1 Tax=Lasius niger TaxID=67767 RepID=A0A0J7L4C3_LASNI|nr:hypothetical protein RF55_2317 [Lasius niger]
MLANSNFLNDEDLFCGSKVIYGVEQDMNFFASDRDNNEDPETLSGPGVDSASMTICQSKKFEWKLSNQDKRIMCSNYDLWESSIYRQIGRNTIKLIDAYSIPKIIASAAPYNTGIHAGKDSHSIDLGDQGANALDANSEEGFENMIFNLQQAALEVGMQCGEGEEGDDGVSASPVIIIPLQLQRYAVKLLKGLGTCCSTDNALVTGHIGDMLGYKIIASRWLQPANFGAAGDIAPVLMVDPNQILHAFDVITNKWYEGGKEEYVVPVGSPGFASTEESIVSWINGNGVGATISVIAIPTYAFVTGVAVHIDAEEAGLTFNLKTRNGLALPSAKTIQVTATGSACDITRTQDDGSFDGFGALSGAAFIDIFGRDGDGEFSLEADEIMLEVATMPTSGTVSGSFNITVSAAYEVIHRAEA